jgi:hypothetical protein
LNEKSKTVILRHLPRNVWVVTITSFLTDISSDMLINLIPLFLSNILGVRTVVIGIIETAALAAVSLLKFLSGCSLTGWVYANGWRSVGWYREMGGLRTSGAFPFWGCSGPDCGCTIVIVAAG